MGNCRKLQVSQLLLAAHEPSVQGDSGLPEMLQYCTDSQKLELSLARFQEHQAHKARSGLHWVLMELQVEVADLMILSVDAAEPDLKLLEPKLGVYVYSRVFNEVGALPGPRMQLKKLVSGLQQGNVASPSANTGQCDTVLI